MKKLQENKEKRKFIQRQLTKQMKSNLNIASVSNRHSSLLSEAAGTTPSMANGTQQQATPLEEEDTSEDYSTSSESSESSEDEHNFKDDPGLAEARRKIRRARKAEARRLRKLQEKASGRKIVKFSFLPPRIMSQLTLARIEKLGAYWKQFDDGLDLQKFTQLMLDRIRTVNDDEKYELVFGCYRLFCEVDINGDGQMEWGEFMQYIIDAVSDNTIKSGDGAQETVGEQIARLKAKKYHRFAISKKVLDKSSHYNVIQRSLLCASSQMVLSFERYSKDLKFYDWSKPVCLCKETIPMKKKGFITSVAYDEAHRIFAATTTDNQLHFFIKKKQQIEWLKSIEASRRQARIFYMPEQQLWLTADEDHNLCHWSIAKSGELLQTLDIHKDEITDCIELQNPHCVVTCSLDKTIVFYDVEHREQLRVISNRHDKGIRFLRYQNIGGPQMISIGHEVFANVWAPESLVSDIHIGRLKGHKTSITDGQYLNKAPFFVTVDEINNVMFWDIQTLICIQQLVAPHGMHAEGIVVLTNNVFWIYGKRFTQFDTYQVDETNDDDGSGATQTMGNKAESPYALQALINDYLLNIFVVKKKEVRMYDLKNGQLQAMHNNVFDNLGTNGDITKFRIDKRHRKAYVANNLGQIIVVNCQSGVQLKTVTQYMEDRNEIKRYETEKALRKEDLEEVDSVSLPSLASSNYGSDNEGADGDQNIYDADLRALVTKNREKKKQANAMAKRAGQAVQDSSDSDDEDFIKRQEKLNSPEINDMHLIWEDEMIMMICSNAREFMVFDESEPEESKLLRRVCGGHEEEITILAYDYHLSLVATGCINGEIALYDFETSKIEGLLIGHTGDITALEFLSPYPLLISASMDYTVAIWGVRPCPVKLQNVCLRRILNVSWRSDTDVKCVVSRLLVWKGDKMKACTKHRRLKGKQLPAAAYRKFEDNQVFSQRDMADIFKEEFPETKYNQYANHTDKMKQEMVVNGQIYQEILADPISNTFMTLVPNDREEWNATVDEERERIMLYIGDELGYIKLLNITDMIMRTGIEKVAAYTESRASFNPRRQEIVDTTAFAKQYRRSAQQEGVNLPPAIDPEMSQILIRESKAHADVVTSLARIEYDDCACLLSASKDCTVRTWSLELDLWGSLSQTNERDDLDWYMPTKQKQLMDEAEVQEVERLIDELNMDLDHPRRTLAIDHERKPKKKKRKAITRANWLQLQEDREAAEREMARKQEINRREVAAETQKTTLLLSKMDNVIADQDVQIHLLQMGDVPRQLPAGPLRNLQLELNDMQSKFLKERNDQMAAAEATLVGAHAATTSLTHSPVRRNNTKKSTSQVRGTSKQNSVSSSRQMAKHESVERKGVSKSPSSPQQSEKSKSITLARSNIGKVSKPSLPQMIERSEKKTGIGRFTDSKKDRQSILEMGMIPNLRKKLASLTKGRERFNMFSQTSVGSPSYVGGMALKETSGATLDLSSYLTSAKHQDKIKVLVEPIMPDNRESRNLMKSINLVSQRDHKGPSLQPMLRDQRAFSIADSEIQKIEAGGMLIGDHSKSSLHSVIKTTDRRARNLSFVQHDAGKSIQYLPSLPKIESRQVQRAEIQIRENLSLLKNHNDATLNASSADYVGPTGASSYGTQKAGQAMSRMLQDSKVSLKEVRIRMPEGSAALHEPEDSLIIPRNPFSVKFEKADAMLNFRARHKAQLMSERGYNGSRSPRDTSFASPDSTADPPTIASATQLKQRVATMQKLGVAASHRRFAHGSDSGALKSLEHAFSTMTPARGDSKLRSRMRLASATRLADKFATMSEARARLQEFTDDDHKKTEQLENIKQKWIGNESKMHLEHLNLKESLKHQREELVKLKKKQRKATIDV